MLPEGLTQLDDGLSGYLMVGWCMVAATVLLLPRLHRESLIMYRAVSLLLGHPAELVDVTVL